MTPVGGEGGVEGNDGDTSSVVDIGTSSVVDTGTSSVCDTSSPSIVSSVISSITSSAFDSGVEFGVQLHPLSGPISFLLSQSQSPIAATASSRESDAVGSNEAPSLAPITSAPKLAFPKSKTPPGGAASYPSSWKSCLYTSITLCRVSERTFAHVQPVCVAGLACDFECACDFACADDSFNPSLDVDGLRELVLCDARRKDSLCALEWCEVDALEWLECDLDALEWLECDLDALERLECEAEALEWLECALDALELALWLATWLFFACSSSSAPGKGASSSASSSGNGSSSTYEYESAAYTGCAFSSFASRFCAHAVDSLPFDPAFALAASTFWRATRAAGSPVVRYSSVF